jgi:gamma-glutamylputrescine oxidase
MAWSEEKPEPPWGAPPWRAAPQVASVPPPEACDVAVVGAGLSGLATARRLARQGRTVAVLEADRVGAGASGRTGGIVLEETVAGPLEGLGECIPALLRAVQEADIDCGLRLGGCRELTHEPGPAALWRDGEGWLGVAGLVPGGTLDPSALLAGLVRDALAAGASLHTSARVERIEPASPPVLHVGERRVRAQHVVLGLNAWLPRLLPEAVRLRTALTLALCTEPLADATLTAIGLADRLPFYTLDLPYLWGRPLDDGRVVFGGGLAFDSGDALERVDVGTGPPAAQLAHLETRVRELHPALAQVRIANRWGGPVALAPAGIPLLGRLRDVPEAIVTGGFSGHGVALAFRVAEILCAAIVDDRPLPPWGAPAPPKPHASAPV